VPIDTKRLGKLLHGVATLLEDPDARAELAAKTLELAKRVGKEAALDAMRKNGASPEAIEAMRQELERAIPRR
jgi:hypothetical protein